MRKPLIAAALLLAFCLPVMAGDVPAPPEPPPPAQSATTTVILTLIQLANSLIK